MRGSILHAGCSILGAIPHGRANVRERGGAAFIPICHPISSARVPPSRQGARMADI